MDIKAASAVFLAALAERIVNSRKEPAWLLNWQRKHLAVEHPEGYFQHRSA